MVQCLWLFVPVIIGLRDEHLGMEVPQQQPKLTPRTAKNDDGRLFASRQLRFELGNGPEFVRFAKTRRLNAQPRGGKGSATTPTNTTSHTQPSRQTHLEFLFRSAQSASDDIRPALACSAAR